MNQNILYSIITPTYNRADCIMRCIESVERNVKTQIGGGEYRTHHSG